MSFMQQELRLYFRTYVLRRWQSSCKSDHSRINTYAIFCYLSPSHERCQCLHDGDRIGASSWGHPNKYHETAATCWLINRPYSSYIYELSHIHLSHRSSNITLPQPQGTSVCDCFLTESPFPFQANHWPSSSQSFVLAKPVILLTLNRYAWKPSKNKIPIKHVPRL